VIHDLNDDACIKSLSAIKGAMGKHSRVLIVDAIVPLPWRPSIDGSAAPKPLLPNYGTAARGFFVPFVPSQSLPRL
jgi:hypothetical protein